MDIFESRSARPMLIATRTEPFNDEQYIYEVKHDGERCLAYVGGAIDPVALVNKRDALLLPRFPEFASIHKQVRQRCILDCELVAGQGRTPEFSKIVGRSSLDNSFKIGLRASLQPATLVCFDILYADGKRLTNLPLMERKDILENVVEETPLLAISRYVEIGGPQFFENAKSMGLEGVVAKRRTSEYYMGKRTDCWTKWKALLDDEFVIAGVKGNGSRFDLFLGQYNAAGKLQFFGKVSAPKNAIEKIGNTPIADTCPLIQCPKAENGIIWLKPAIVCTVSYLERYKTGKMRHAEFKMLRPDKSPDEAVAPASAKKEAPLI